MTSSAGARSSCDEAGDGGLQDGQLSGGSQEHILSLDCFITGLDSGPFSLATSVESGTSCGT